MTEESTVEMFIDSLVVDPRTGQPIIILRNEQKNHVLPIWIGAPEATSIAAAIKQIPLPRPLTHDLVALLLTQLGARVERVLISALKEGTFYSDILVTRGDTIVRVDARPSDALAIAIRTSAPIYVAQSVIEQSKDAGDVIKKLMSMRIEGRSTQGDDEEQPQDGDESAGPESQSPVNQMSQMTSADLNDKEKLHELLNQLGKDDFKFEQ